MQSIGVIGAGQMGAGIAQVSAQAGYRVLLSDIGLAQAEKGKAGIAKQLDRAVAKEKITAEARDAALALIEPIEGVDAMADAALVIEAATEREAIKRQIFADVGRVLGADAILASNTSSIPITRLSAGGARPGAFRRRALLQPGAGDGSDRADPRPRHLRRDGRQGRGLCAGARQAGGARERCAPASSSTAC